VLLFAFGISEFTHIHHAANRGFRQRRNLHQIQFCFIRYAYRFRYRNDAKLLSLRADEPHLWCRYLLINTL
jgi:hypothetical protein